MVVLWFAEQCMAVAREWHIKQAKLKGSYLEVVRDGSGTPFLAWCQGPPWPRLGVEAESDASAGQSVDAVPGGAGPVDG